jgi:hypothetical protein
MILVRTDYPCLRVRRHNDNLGLLLQRPQGGDDRDQLLSLYRRVTTLDRYSNSSSTAQRV